MAKEPKKELDWMGLDESTLKGDALKAREAHREASAAARAKREEFEQAVVKAARTKKLIKDEETYVFAFLPGRVRIAVVPLAEVKKKADGGGKTVKL